MVDGTSVIGIRSHSHRECRWAGMGFGFGVGGHGMSFGYGILEVAVWVMVDYTCSLGFDLDIVPSGKPSVTTPTLSLCKGPLIRTPGIL